MATGIYAKLSDGAFILLEERKYEREDDLQSLIATHPALLGGEQISPDDPRRWLLIKREQGVPDSETSGARWSVDHLFLDQDAVPTLVEVKRKEDSRIRREVVGQMLDYASHATALWKAGDLRESFERGCRAAGEDPDQRIADLTLANPMESDAFWELVGTQLAAGRVRLIFAADRLPSEVKRIIEFLNDQMSQAEVLGVEIHHYTNGDIRAFVPRVIGVSETIALKRASGGGSANDWDEKRFFENLASNVNEAHLAAIRKLYDYVVGSSYVFEWGKGSTDGSVIVRSPDRGRTVINFDSKGRLFVYFDGVQGSSHLDNIHEGLRDFFARDVGAPLGPGTKFPAAASNWWNGVERIIAKLREIETELHKIA